MHTPPIAMDADSGAGPDAHGMLQGILHFPEGTTPEDAQYVCDALHAWGDDPHRRIFATPDLILFHRGSAT